MNSGNINNFSRVCIQQEEISVYFFARWLQFAFFHFMVCVVPHTAIGYCIDVEEAGSVKRRYLNFGVGGLLSELIVDFSFGLCQLH